MKYCLNNVIFSDVLFNVLLESIDPFSLRRGECFIDSLLYSLNSLLVSLYMVCPGTVVFNQCWQRQSWSTSQWVLASLASQTLSRQTRCSPALDRR